MDLIKKFIFKHDGNPRQGCKGFSSFVRSFSEQKTVAKRSPTQPALPLVAELVEALAEGGAQMVKIEANSRITRPSNLKLPFKLNYKKSAGLLLNSQFK